MAATTASTATDIAIGIDLGTTNCCVAVFLNGRPEPVPNSTGSYITPSYVSFDDDVQPLVGQEAKDNLQTNTTGTVFAVKRIIGKRFDEEEVIINRARWPFTLVADEDGMAAIEIPQGCAEKTVWKPEEISAIVLKYLKKTAEEYTTRPVKRAVITVPANFKEEQRRMTFLAAKLAGLDVIGMINEPTAAAVAYGLQSTDDGSAADKTILVYDFGGGTLDVSIIKSVNRSSFEVKSTSGNMHLGGEDFDEKIMQHFVFEFEKDHGPGVGKSPSALALLRKQAELAKQSLSGVNRDRTTVAISALHDGKDFRTTLTRSTMEEVCADLFTGLLEPIQQALLGAEMTREDITHVVLVGGSSRIPRVRDIVQGFFPAHHIYKDIHPDQAIAIGAAVMAQNPGQVRIAEVTHAHLGTDVADGSLSVIIPQYSPIPHKVTKSYTTASHFQTSVAVRVYEGNDVRGDKNRLWKVVHLNGIEPDLMGVPKIDITYSYDVNGLLEVTVEEDGTENTVTATIQVK
ncbi:Heat shock 70 kDa protein [Hypsibius exemplaris]|uniref:Heat shock 70 kDa protein n=1 Tax=Hypsibius exemplaris TaxID=2072580 RepID=A0A9X6NGV0_HYPEX|nr:Heat shock 70 kDa protein [Hypsibius exemplaris]